MENKKQDVIKLTEKEKTCRSFFLLYTRYKNTYKENVLVFLILDMSVKHVLPFFTSNQGNCLLVRLCILQLNKLIYYIYIQLNVYTVFKLKPLNLRLSESLISM